MQQANIIYLSHGGGPLPLLGDAKHQSLIKTLKALAGKIRQPEAIIVFSAHWEENPLAITSAENPGLIYDYYGFPEAAYQIEYPLTGSPQLAKLIDDCLRSNRIESRLDHSRGFDHGVFVPLKLMFPSAEIPCVQVSLHRNLSASAHIEIGKALRPLLNRNLLVIGSGSSFHNLPYFFDQSPESIKRNNEFHQWLKQTLCNPELSERLKSQRLVDWQIAPHANFCHPRQEHLMPLHLCFGLAENLLPECHEFELNGKQLHCYSWSPNSLC